jgi:preprotein translocase subunit SecD
VTLDAKGGRMMRDSTRDNVGNAMAAILFEKGKGEVLTVATIQGEFGSEFQITGMGTTENAAELALLLRAGALAAPWSSSRKAPSARRWARTTSPRASTA